MMHTACTLVALKSRNVTLSVAALALLASVAVPWAEAGLVVSNLNNVVDQAWTIGRDDVDLTDSPVAIQFTTGAGPGWQLDSVVLNLGRFNNSFPAAGDIDAYLALDNAGVPGALFSFLPSAAPTGLQEVITLAPLFSTQLVANTSYWVVTAADVGDTYLWNTTFDVSQTGLPGWSIGDTAYGGYPAGSWTPLRLPGGPQQPDVDLPTLLAVNASSVPVPSALALNALGLAVLGLGAARRRRRSAP